MAAERSLKDVTSTQPKQLDGVEWVVKGTSFRPQWTTGPDIERIREVVSRELRLPSQQEVTITSFAKGTFNKLYTIRFDEKELIMRVALPVDPRWKTLSEVATVEWVGCNTNIPVPEIFAYNASRDNPIGFEWILMSRLPGRPLLDVWKTMDLAAKKQLTHQVAVLTSSMFKKQLHGIGNIYSVPKGTDGEECGVPEVQRIVSSHFFCGDRILQPVLRGPFRSSRDWLEASLLLCENECDSVIAKWGEWPDEGDVENPYGSLEVIRKLKIVLDNLFPSRKLECSEPTILFHGDLAQRNILVDDAGVLTGVVDWECVSALPLWKACNYPKFLQEDVGEPDWNVSDSSCGKCERSFWDDMVDDETTVLRKFFLEEMRRLEPRWVEVFEASERQRDFAATIDYCTVYDVLKHISAWADDVAGGKENILSLVDNGGMVLMS